MRNYVQSCTGSVPDTFEIKRKKLQSQVFARSSNSLECTVSGRSPDLEPVTCDYYNSPNIPPHSLQEAKRLEMERRA